MTTPLILALKEYNKGNKNLWTVPRKGTLPHDRLLTILGNEESAKRQQAERYNKIVKRQEELSRLEHNLGIVLKVNKIRKFLGSAKEKIEKKKGKRTEISKMSFE